MYTIIGGGLAGLSAAFHLNDYPTIIYEKKEYLGGHVYSEVVNNFTWDEGPHVSFTKNSYVKNLFANNLDNDYLEYPVKISNYYKGNWIPHPAQANMYAIPQPLRSYCFNDFLNSRKSQDITSIPSNYKDWLIQAFGNTFYETFPKAYTKKYWTLDPEFLTCDWLGERVFYPNIKEVSDGFLKPLSIQTHYINSVRYPKRGGFYSFIKKIEKGLNVELNMRLDYISFQDKFIVFSNKKKVFYDKLVITIPLPEIIKKSDAPDKIKEAANNLSCTSVLLVNIEVNHTAMKEYNWMYVYDEDKYSTRINCTELLSELNAPVGKCGIQVEVYFSKYKPMTESFEAIAKKVCLELCEMGLIQNEDFIENYHTKYIEWANVIFDHNRHSNLDLILDWLSLYGYQRNSQDLYASTNWETYIQPTNSTIYLAGRFAEWKYYWTDDCVLRGKNLLNENSNYSSC